MANKILYNGKITGDHLEINVRSEALNYGMGLFETMLYENGQIFFYQEHIRRLEDACSRLTIDFDLTTLSPERIYSLIRRNGDEGKCLRVKILYLPLSAEWDTIVYTREYTRSGDSITVCSHFERRERQLANFKTTNYFDNLYWKNFYMHRFKADEFLYRNLYGNFVEGCSSNLFCVKEGVLYCADAANDFLPGIMHAKIIKNFRALGFTEVAYRRHGIREGMIKAADEVFMTNSLMLARSVGLYYDTERNRSFKLMGRTWARKIRQYFLG